MISCLQSGLSTTNGALPDGGCSVSELEAGTDPLGGAFKICLDSASNPNNVMSVESDYCTDFIVHNAVASADESGGDGSSVEEKLEQLDNIGDVRVTRSAVNPRNGGYTWKVQFVYDADGPCEQKDDMVSLCNSPGNVQRLCNGSSACDTDSLKGTCLKPGSCDKLTVLDASDKLNGVHFPGGNEKQVVFVKDSEYLGWEDGSVVDSSSVLKECKLLINGVATECIKHNALAEKMMTSIQGVLDGGVGGSVRVDRTRSEHLAGNGFVYYLTFYDTGDIAVLSASFIDGACANDFEASQSVVVMAMIDGALHSANCEDCADGIVQRGDFTTLEGTGDGLTGALAWNAESASVKAHLEQLGDRVVDVTRTVLDKYGTIMWMITFTKNVGTTPPGSGDVDPITVSQDLDTSGRSANVVVNEMIKGSADLSGTFNLNYQSSGGPRTFSFEESPQRMLRKLEEMSTIGNVHVSRDCYPSCSLGGWGGTAVVPGTVGGYEWKIHFLKNPGSNHGFTFPPGSGLVYPPAIDHALLSGKDATVVMDTPSEGSAPLTGAFSLGINGEETELIPYNIDSSAMEHTINDLQSVGDVSVESGFKTNHLIAGITASVVTDGTIASLTGGELREHLAPGETFRIGGSNDKIDGAENVGSASLSPLSPILSDVQLDNRDHLNVEETIQIGADMYSVVKNGIEVQQVAVHRSSNMNTYFFSLRHPEIQVVKWSSGSPVTAGSFFLKLRYVDRINSDTSGSVIYKEMKTPCINFDTTADDVKRAIETDAVLNGLDENSVRVLRSGNRSFSSDHGYFYTIYFVGGDVRGNVLELTSDFALTGMDSTGGNSCIAFDSSTNDSSLEIWTENDSRALGTDTPRAEVVVDANTAIVDGEFQLSVNYFGQQLTTECIPWDGTAEQVKLALESLDNVDSVRVDRTGDGVLSDVGTHILIDDYSFQHTGGSSFLASASDSLSDALFEGDIIKISAQADSSIFYKIVSLFGRW